MSNPTHEIRHLIRQMARENPTWGRRRIQAGAFLATHARDIVAVDFFLVPTLTFRLLFVFVVLRHDRRQLVYLNVTDRPTAVWARQLVEAFPDDTAPKYLLRDRDRIYGDQFGAASRAHGDSRGSHRPQRALAQLFRGAAHRFHPPRGCLDHFVSLNDAHLRRLLRAYLASYNTARPLQALGNNSPHPREVQPPARGRIVALPQVGGLHHCCQRTA